MSLSSFNRDLLNDRLEQYAASLDRALTQHRLLSNRLETVKKRFDRASENGNKTFKHKYSMQITCISGTMCMYEEYMKRTAEQLNRLKAFQHHINKTSQQRLSAGLSQDSAAPAAGDKHPATKDDKANEAKEKSDKTLSSSEDVCCANKCGKLADDEPTRERKRRHSETGVESTCINTKKRGP